jgi:hypothetical protein
VSFCLCVSRGAKPALSSVRKDRCHAKSKFGEAARTTVNNSPFSRNAYGVLVLLFVPHAAAFAKGAGDDALPERLVALLPRRLEAASAAVALLSENGAQKHLTDALGIAASPAAIDALGRLAHDTALSEKLRVDAIIAFVQM